MVHYPSWKTDISTIKFRQIFSATFDGIPLNFQEVNPFLLEAAAQYPDFGYSIKKIKEKNELELAHTNPSVGFDRKDDC